MELAKETCAIMATQVTYEIRKVSTPRFNNINCTKLIFFFYVFVYRKSVLLFWFAKN